MVTLPEMPPQIARLLRDDRGYPVPWFVSWIDGKPEFRCADGEKLKRAIGKGLCWVCGQRLDPNEHVFVIGPMCAINCTTAEPPCHAECAEFSAMACPFLSKPAAVRREANIPEGSQDPAGFMIRRNPGVTCLWFCRGFNLLGDGNGGILFRLPGPSRVKWFAEGRKATREEILESINSGLPLLREMAEQDGAGTVLMLEQMVASAMRFVPAT